MDVGRCGGFRGRIAQVMRDALVVDAVGVEELLELCSRHTYRPPLGIGHQASRILRAETDEAGLARLEQLYEGRSMRTMPLGRLRRYASKDA